MTSNSVFIEKNEYGSATEDEWDAEFLRIVLKGHKFKGELRAVRFYWEHDNKQWTVASIIYHGRPFMGASRCHTWKDRFDEREGVERALGRAVGSMKGELNGEF